MSPFPSISHATLDLCQDQQTRYLPLGAGEPLWPSKPEQLDVIDRGLLTWHMALQLLERYQTHLFHCYPIVPLAGIDDPSQLRRHRPVLFLATITAAAAVTDDRIRDTLHDEIIQTYANLVMVKGTKSLELLQAMLITIAWYRPCGSYNDTKYLQFTQAASLMAHELGLGESGQGISLKFAEADSLEYNVSNLQVNNLWWTDERDSIALNIECVRTLVASYIQTSTYVHSTL